MTKYASLCQTVWCKTAIAQDAERLLTTPLSGAQGAIKSTAGAIATGVHNVNPTHPPHQPTVQAGDWKARPAYGESHAERKPGQTK